MEIDNQLLQERIKWKPFPAQQEILTNQNRDKVICAGTRFGKSMLCAYVAFKELLLPNKRIWVVSLTYEMSRKIFNYVVDFAGRFDRRLLKGVSNRPTPEFRIPERKSWLQCKSIETPTSLMGEELDLVLLDEAARMKSEIWERYLIARLASRQGKSFTISTPFGKNWFYYRWLDVKSVNGSFHFKSNDSPYFPLKEYERIKSKLPRDIFLQEYEATFLEGAATIFRHIRECVGECLSEPQRGQEYIMGLDIGKVLDFTVVTIMSKQTHKVAYWDRFQKLPYSLMKQRIIDVARKYSVKIIIDSLNVGAVIAEDLRTYHLNVQEFKSVGNISPDWEKRGSKERLIEKLGSFFEESNLTIPDNPILIDELESYTFELSPNGNLRYNAPQGFHDDCVISLALAVWGLEMKQKQENIIAAKSIPSIKKSFQYK